MARYIPSDLTGNSGIGSGLTRGHAAGPGTRSLMSSWCRGLRQFTDKRLPDCRGVRYGLSRITTESHCWRTLGTGEEKSQLDAAEPDSWT